MDPISLTAGAAAIGGADAAAAGGTAAAAGTGLGTIGTVGSAIGSGISAIGALFTGSAQKQMYQYKAGIALMNRQIDLQNAAWSLEKGGIQSEESGLKSGQEIAQTKVVQSGSGFDVNTGSGAAVRDSQTTAAQFDQNVISWDAAKTSYGFQTKAAADLAEANLDVAAGSNALTAGEISATGSFISGASSVASKWYQSQSIGMTS
jgi:hypothetical protein